MKTLLCPIACFIGHSLYSDQFALPVGEQRTLISFSSNGLISFNNDYINFLCICVFLCSYSVVFYSFLNWFIIWISISLACEKRLKHKCCHEVSAYVGIIANENSYVILIISLPNQLNNIKNIEHQRCHRHHVCSIVYTDCHTWIKERSKFN